MNVFIGVVHFYPLFGLIFTLFLPCLKMADFIGSLSYHP